MTEINYRFNHVSMENVISVESDLITDDNEFCNFTS